MSEYTVEKSVRMHIDKDAEIVDEDCGTMFMKRESRSDIYCNISLHSIVSRRVLGAKPRPRGRQTRTTKRGPVVADGPRRFPPATRVSAAAKVKIKEDLRRPGIGPGSHAWQARILPLDQRRLNKTLPAGRRGSAGPARRADGGGGDGGEDAAKT